MSDGTKIEWSDASWNPVTGCTKVSPGCDHCYAETFAERFRGVEGHPFEQGFDLTLRPERLGQPLRWRRPRRIFVNSMSDLFHADVPDAFIARVWQVMGAAPQHGYQILTKRHARMRSWVSRWYAGEIAEPHAVRPVPNYPGYWVTTHGEILGKRVDTRAGLAQDVGEQGHRRVTMHREGSPSSGSRELVHRLVLTAFARPPLLREQACHRNGDAGDNRLSNLYWGSQEDNWRDRREHGNGRSYSKLSEADVTEIRRRCGAGESAYRVAKDYPVSDTQVRNIVRGDHWVTSQPAAVARKPGRVVLDSVWLGVSVEDQQRADLRIPALLETPAAVRWVSAEPLLGPVDIRPWLPWWRVCGACNGAVPFASLRPDLQQRHRREGHPTVVSSTGLDWVVAGGESGPGARPMEWDWARSLRDQCQQAGVPFLFKQAGSVLAREWGGSGKGGDPAQWPEPFPREYPVRRRPA
jgi:protein gp37